MKRIIFFNLLLLIQFGCIHEDEGRTDFIEQSSLKQSKQTNSSQSIGQINEAVIVKEEKLDEILIAAKTNNTKILGEIKSFLFAIEDCRNYLMDPRLGGASEVEDLPSFDLSIFMTRQREEIVTDEEGNLKLKVTQRYEQALNDERNKNKILKKREDIMKKVLKRCKAKLSAARLKKGFPAKKYPAKLKRNPFGGITILRKAEQTLDDAFEIRELIEKEKAESF